MGWVYFIQEGEGGAIKIGTTTGSPEARRRVLQTAAPRPLHLLTAIPGGPDLERTLHQRFQALQLIGEWFEPGPELVAFIDGALAANGPVPEPVGDDRLERLGLTSDELEAITLEVISRRDMAIADERLAREIEDPDAPQLGDLPFLADLPLVDSDGGLH